MHFAITQSEDAKFWRMYSKPKKKLKPEIKVYQLDLKNESLIKTNVHIHLEDG